MPQEYGRIGQRRFAGIFSEEFLRELQGKHGIEVYREMSENDECALKDFVTVVYLHISCESLTTNPSLSIQG